MSINIDKYININEMKNKIKSYLSDNWVNITIILIIIFIIYKINILLNKTDVPIIKQLNDFKNKQIDDVIAKINNRPYYGKLPPGYSGSQYVGQHEQGGDLIREQIIEQICPMGTYIDNLEIGSNDDHVNYIKGTCSNGKQLELLGKKINKSKTNFIKKTNGIDALNVKYNSNYINVISEIGENENGGKKINCGLNKIIVGYRGRAENPNYNEVKQNSDYKIKHLQFICNDDNAYLNVPLTHKKCGNDGDVCKLDMHNKNIYYGVPGVKVVKISKDKINTKEFTCRPRGFFGIRGDVLPVDDPLPGFDKSCFLERKGISEEDIKKIINENKYRLWGAWSNDEYGKPSKIIKKDM